MIDLDGITKSIESYLREEIDILINKHIENAKKELEDKIKEKTYHIASQVAGNFNVMHRRDEICIMVRTSDLKLKD